jgi:hypothetical protein
VELPDVASDIFIRFITEQIKLRLVRPKNDAVWTDLVKALQCVLDEIRQLSFSSLSLVDLRLKPIGSLL